MSEKPIISISDSDDKKIVTFNYLTPSVAEKLSLIVERDDNNVFKIYIDSKYTYTVFSLDDTGHPIPEFSNIKD